MHRTFPEIIDIIIEWGIIFLLVCTPLALPTRHGTVHLWVYSAMELTIFLLILIWALKKLISLLSNAPDDRYEGRRTKDERRTPPSALRPPNSLMQVQACSLNQTFNRFGFVKTPLNIPIILFVSLIVFQLIPLPSGTFKLLSPETYALYNNTVDPELMTKDEGRRTRDEGRVTKEQTTKSQVQDRPSSFVSRLSSLWHPLTIYHYATKSEFMQILAYIGMFFLVTNMQTLRINRIVMIIISVGFFISILGILQKFTGTTKVFWFIKVASDSPFGTYVNRNHFAGYIVMVIPLSFGFLVSRLGNVSQNKTMTWRSLLTKFESHLFSNIFLLFAVMIMISALFLSLSRGGILSFAAAIMVFATIVGINKQTRSIVKKGRNVIITAMFLAIAFLVWLGSGPTLDRFSEVSPSKRYELINDTINIVKDFPVFGTGMGTFQYIYPKYRTVKSVKHLVYDHAHNDYVELLSDSGFAGFIIVLGGIIAFFLQILVRWKERKDTYAKGLTLGGLCGIIAILCHSVVDFNLHIPANALFLSFLLGFTFNAVNLKRA